MSSTRTIAYDLGKQAALEKVALAAGFLGRTLLGAGMGAGMGALTAGEGNRGRGALMGGALGALGGGLTAGRAQSANIGRLANPQSMGGTFGRGMLLDGATPMQAMKTMSGIGGAGMGAAGGLAGGLGARATAAPEPTWQDKLKALPGQAYEGLQGLLR